MKKRWALRLGVIALLGTAGFVAFLLTRPGSPINRRTFEKIQIGMTLAEVEAIIGLPPGDYATGELEVVDFELSQISIKALSPTEKQSECDDLTAFLRKFGERVVQRTAWVTDSAVILIRTDHDDKVELKYLLQVRRSYVNAWQLIRGHLRI